MENEFLSKVFYNLFIGLLLTFATGYLISTNVDALIFIFSGYTPFILAIIQIAIAIYLPVRITKMSNMTSKILYYIYAILTGLTLSSIFVVYEISSVIWIFLVTSIIFGLFAFIGKTTKVDLSKFGIYLFMGLIAVLILSIINIFILNNTLDMVACIIGIVIFVGYTAYDMQKISRLNQYNLSEDNIATIGAFELYLDFINLFIRLLRIFGKSND